MAEMGPYKSLAQEQVRPEAPIIGKTSNGINIVDPRGSGDSEAPSSSKYCGLVRTDNFYGPQYTSLVAEFVSKDSTVNLDLATLPQSHHPDAQRALNDLNHAVGEIKKNPDSIFKYPKQDNSKTDCNSYIAQTFRKPTPPMG